MKNLLLCCLLLCNTVLFAQTESKEKIYTFVDREAAFKGGQKAMAAYFQKNIVYPQAAIQSNTEGKCYLRFVISKRGTVSKVIVDRGVKNCPECDREAVRVIKNMPKWKPSKENGQKVSSYFTIPINFTLD